MAQFEIFPGNNQQFFFRLKANDGEKVLSSEAYATKLLCMGAIAAVKANAPTDRRYHRKLSPAGKHCFVLQDAQGQPIGQSEPYLSAHALENGIACVKRIAAKADILDLT